MKISNFKLIERKRNGGIDTIYFAEIDVTTGIFKKKTEKRKICKKGIFWFFSDTGRYTPYLIVERLARSYFAESGGEDCY